MASFVPAFALGYPHLQFWSQVPKAESHTHASRANHSCEMRHDGQNDLLKKTGMERNLACSICMPVVTGLPVFGQRIMSSPITNSA